MARSSIFGRVFAALVVGGVSARMVLPAPAPSPAPPAASPPYASSAAPAERAAKDRPLPEYRRGQELLEGYLGRRLAAPGTRFRAASDTVGRACGATGQRCGLDVLVATLPDPFDSHLDWAYDSDFESLRRAYERAGYVIDRFWFPAARDSAAPEGADRVPARDAEPGVVLFRDASPQSRGLRLLYVVGEMPTRGVHARALRAALAERTRLLADAADFVVPAPARGVVRVLGPAFSGSAASLAGVLLSAMPRGDSARVVTGTATTDAIRRTLSVPGRVSFAATVNPTSTLDAVFDSLVLRRLKVPPSRIAVLRESSTLYGRSAGRERDGMVVIPVPLNVSGMRAVYAEQADRTAEAVPAAERLPLPGRESHVPLPLQDAPRPREDPLVASQLTAPAVEIAIDEIVHALREHQVRLVGLQFTDIRDKLFLAREIRSRMHEVQFFTYESNALLLRPEMAGYLRGMLVVSSYPLLLENQWWAPKHASGFSERQVFASEGAQGLYNAALLQLGADTSAVEYGMTRPGWRKPAEAALKSADAKAGGGKAALSAKPLLSPFTPDSSRPPVWITAVGTGSFVPIAVRQPTDTATLSYVAAVPLPLRRDAGPDPHDAALFAVGGCISLGLGMGGLALFFVRSSRERAGSATLEDDVARWWARVLNRQGRAARAHKEAWPLWRSVHSASLLLHREMYIFLLLVSLAALVMPLFELINLDHDGAFPVPFVARLVRTVWWAGVAAAAVLWTAILLRNVADGRDYALRGAWTRPSSGILWNVEVVGRAMVIVAGVLFLALTRWVVQDLRDMRARPGLGFELLYHRALDVASGVSPLAPLMVVATGFAAWSVWHLNRIRLLSRTTACEYALLRRAWSEPGRRRRRGDPAPARLGDAAASLRDALFLLLPDRRSAVLGLVLAALAGWLFSRFGLSIDTIAFSAGGDLREWSTALISAAALAVAAVAGWMAAPEALERYRLWAARRNALLAGGGEPPAEAGDLGRTARLAVAGAGAAAALGLASLLDGRLGAAAGLAVSLAGLDGTSSFDLLLRFGIIGTVVATVWALYRFMAVWAALGTLLRVLEETPLLNAFSRIPARVSRLTRLSLVGSPEREVVDAVANAQWSRLVETWNPAPGAAAGPASTPNAFDAAQAQAPPPVTARAFVAGAAADAALVAAMDGATADDGTWRCRDDFWKVEEPAGKFETVLAALERTWSRVPPADQLARMRAWHPDPDGDGAPAEAPSPYAALPAGVGEWLATAEEFVAVQAVDYVQTVLEQLRNLALFLFVSLLITTALLTSYPFYPQGLVKGVFMLVLLATVATLLTVMVQMNRDEILSRIAGTTPGRITWNSAFVFNAAAVGILPLLALVSSEYPAVRAALFSWVEPLVRTLFKS